LNNVQSILHKCLESELVSLERNRDDLQDMVDKRQQRAMPPSAALATALEKVAMIAKLTTLLAQRVTSSPIFFTGSRLELPAEFPPGLHSLRIPFPTTILSDSPSVAVVLNEQTDGFSISVFNNLLTNPQHLQWVGVVKSEITVMLTGQISVSCRVTTFDGKPQTIQGSALSGNREEVVLYVAMVLLLLDVLRTSQPRQYRQIIAQATKQPQATGDTHVVCDLTPHLEALVTGKSVGGTAKRLHSVMGHWVNHSCGRKVWRKAHTRGNEALGTITHDYVLQTANPNLKMSFSNSQDCNQ